jgi:hypothetical protein
MKIATTAPDLTRDEMRALCLAANWPVADGECGERHDFASHPAARHRFAAGPPMTGASSRSGVAPS